MDSPDQNTGVGSLSLLQGIFPAHGSNPSLLHCRWISLPAEPQGKPRNTWVGSLSLLQQIFLTQESNWGLLHWRQILYQLSYQGSHMVGPFLIFRGLFVVFSIAIRYHVTIPPTVQFNAFFFFFFGVKNIVTHKYGAKRVKSSHSNWNDLDRTVLGDKDCLK